MRRGAGLKKVRDLIDVRVAERRRARAERTALLEEIDAMKHRRLALSKEVARISEQVRAHDAREGGIPPNPDRGGKRFVDD